MSPLLVHVVLLVFFMVLCDKRCLDLSLVCSHPDFPFIIRTIPVLFPMDLTEGGDALQEGHRAQSRVDGTNLRKNWE